MEHNNFSTLTRSWVFKENKRSRPVRRNPNFSYDILHIFSATKHSRKHTQRREKNKNTLPVRPTRTKAKGLKAPVWKLSSKGPNFAIYKAFPQLGIRCTQREPFCKWWVERERAVFQSKTVLWLPRRSSVKWAFGNRDWKCILDIVTSESFRESEICGCFGEIWGQLLEREKSLHRFFFSFWVV